MGNVLSNVVKKNVIINSSNEIIKLKIAPATKAGLMMGKVMYHTAQKRDAPRLRAASSKVTSKVCKLAPTDIITKGIVIVRCAGT
jgi:hypothetical protein